MATQFTPRLLLPFWEKGDRDWHIQYAQACAILEALEALATLSVRPTESPSATLNVAIAAGSFVKSDGTISNYAGTASQTLTASTTNYLYLTDAGVLTVNTTGWPAATFHVRIATVVCDATTVTAITRERIVWSSVGKGRDTLYLPLTGGNFTDTTVVTVGLGSTNGTKIGATGNKLAFLGATPIVQQANTVDLVVLLSNLGLRVTGGNPPLNLGTGAITCGALNVGGLITLTDAQNIAVGTTTGTKFGTSTAQKLGFWNATPIVQPANTVELVALLSSLGLRATGGNPDLNLGTGAITCGAFNVGGLTTVADGQNIAVGTSTGTKLGTAATQKLGKWGVTPIVQPASANQAAVGALTTVALTNSTTGTATTTLGDVGGSFSQTAINNNFATLAVQHANVLADLASLRTLLNQLRTDLVAGGNIKGSA